MGNFSDRKWAAGHSGTRLVWTSAWRCRRIGQPSADFWWLTYSFFKFMTPTLTPLQYLQHLCCSAAAIGSNLRYTYIKGLAFQGSTPGNFPMSYYMKSDQKILPCGCSGQNVALRLWIDSDHRSVVMISQKSLLRLPVGDPVSTARMLRNNAHLYTCTGSNIAIPPSMPNTNGRISGETTMAKRHLSTPTQASLKSVPKSDSARVDGITPLPTPVNLTPISQTDKLSSATSSYRVFSAPIGFAPIGINKIYHPLGELPVAKVAKELNLPYCLSTAGSTALHAP
ncbi:hypothetical protein KC326_g181 [Hortaea werneckii]|nr:hypothetical protein KC326_g181 [Hortaea werneckii]